MSHNFTSVMLKYLELFEHRTVSDSGRQLAPVTKVRLSRSDGGSCNFIPKFSCDFGGRLPFNLADNICVSVIFIFQEISAHFQCKFSGSSCFKRMEWTCRCPSASSALSGHVLVRMWSHIVSVARSVYQWTIDQRPRAPLALFKAMESSYGPTLAVMEWNFYLGAVVSSDLVLPL